MYLGGSYYNIVLEKHGGLQQCLGMLCHVNWYIVSSAGEAWCLNLWGQAVQEGCNIRIIVIMSSSIMIFQVNTF